jgi:hypothetical protein
MTSFQALTRADPIGSMDIEALSADPLFDQLLNEIVAENPDEAGTISAAALRDNDLGNVMLGRRPEQHRLQRRLALAATLVVVIGATSLSIGLVGSSSGIATTPWRQARILPGNGEGTAGRQTVGSWELVGDVVSTGWQQNTVGPPPGNITCPSVNACYALAGTYATPDVNAPLLSESLYVTSDLGRSWSVLPMPNGFDPTSGLTCADSSDCSAGGTLNESSVFVTTTDSGHQWTIVPLTVKSGYQLFELSCSSGDDCQGVVGPSWAAQLESPKGGRLTERLPHELFVTTSDAGRTWESAPLEPSYWVTTFACPDASRCVVTGISKVAYAESFSEQQLQAMPAAMREAMARPTLSPVAYFVESTKDNGATWSTGTLPQSPAGPSDLSCVSSSDCAALDLVTIPNPSPCPANGASPPAGSGCSYGPTAVVSDVIATSDGGVTWQTRTFPASIPLPTMTGLYCSSSNDCWATGSEAVPQVIGNLHDGGSSVILQTTDGGLTWSKTTFAVPAGAPNPYGQSFTTIDSISCPTPNMCIALGGSAQSAKTTPVYSYVSQG